MQFIYCFKSEWLKKKRSLASWLVITGAFFTPLIITIAKIVNSSKTAKPATTNDFWESLWSSSWESMAIFLLPLGTILATSLITQLEYKNNTWKQLHTVPQRFTTLFFAKLAVIMVMLLQFLLLFNIGIWLSGIIPALLVPKIPWPGQAIPYLFFFKEDGRYFIEALPILALQYLVSLRFKNFLVPVGMGIILWILSVAVLSWKYGFTIPYTYASYHYLQSVGRAAKLLPFDALALGYFVLFIIIGYTMYVTRREKG